MAASMSHFRLYLLFVVAFLFPASLTLAENYSSANYTVEAPTVIEPAAYGSSSSYGLWGTIPNIAPTGGSSDNFGINPGFLSYTGATMPELSATAHIDSIDLSWTAATGVVAVTYDVGVSLAPGGPYLFKGIQETLSTILENRTPNTAYYLIVRVKELNGTALLGYSNEVAITTLPSQITASGSVPPPAGWEYGPNGLVPLPILPPTYVPWVDPGTGVVPRSGGTSGRDTDESPVILLPGESVTISPALFRQFGYVVTGSGDAEVIIPKAQITLWRLNPATNEFEVWPDAKLATVYTDKFGLYSFMIPAGSYRVEVKAPGYEDYVGSVVAVESTGRLDQRIELVKEVPRTLKTYQVALFALAGLVALWLVIILVRFLVRRPPPPPVS